MNDKDSHNISNIYQNILNEAGFFGGVLQGMEKAHAGKNPWSGMGKDKSGPLGFENEPKIGQEIVLSGNPKIRAKVIERINRKTGKYKIRLIPTPAGKYAFYIWKAKPEGEIMLDDRTQRQIIQMDKENAGAPPIHKSYELEVGYNTAYPTWIDYKTDLKNFGRTRTKENKTV